MRWTSFVILAFIAVVLQTTVVARLTVSGFCADLVLIIAVYYALHASTPDALIAAWVLGMMTDLSGPGRLGVYAFGFGLMALLIVQLRDSMFRDHPLTSLVLTLFCAWGVHAMAGGVYLVLAVLTHSQTHRDIVDVLTQATGSALFTAAVAPHVHYLLARFRGQLGLTSAKRMRMRRTH